MIRVAICDDEPVFLSILEDAIQIFCLTYNLDCETLKFASANELLMAEMDYSILLLDIMLDGEINGLTVAGLLRQRGLSAQIIIITFRDDCYKEGYKVSAHRYIEKPIKQAEFNEAMITAVEILRNRSRIMVAKFGTEELLLNISSIALVESYYNNRHIFMEENSKLTIVITSLTWDQVLEQLPKTLFSFVQKSYLIHFKYLISRTTSTVTMRYRGTINISKRYLSDFDYAYVRYVRQGAELL